MAARDVARTSDAGEEFRDGTWYAVKTRSRSEKKVRERLDFRGFDAYCPLVERERQWADRRKKVLFPLFPGYLFARFALTDLGDVLRVPGVVTVVRSDDGPIPVRPEELEAVRRLETGIAETGEEPHPADYLEPGDPVEVVDGPFVGMTGVLLEERGGVRVAVKLSAIQQAVSVELDRKALRKTSGG